MDHYHNIFTMANANPTCDDGEQNLDDYGYTKDVRTALPQFLAVSVKNLLLLGYGMTLGFPTILIPAVKNPREGEILQLNNSEISWLSSINFIIVPVGCALSGVVTAPMGRRRAMQVVNLPFLVAWLVFHFSATIWHLYSALILTGLAGGLLEAPVLTYVAEITQPHLRGALSATSSMCIILGVFTQFLFGIFLYWRTIALVNIIFTVLAVVTLCFVPESPHWLVSRQRLDEARKSLQWLRGWKNTLSVEKELKDIQALFRETKEPNQVRDHGSIYQIVSMYVDRSFINPFLLISYSFFVGHFSGMTTLQMLRAPIDKYYATFILGLMQILGSVLCVVLVHYTGKRPLTLFSTAAAGVCCMLVAGYEGYIRTHGLALTTTEVNASTNSTTLENIAVDNPYSWIPTTLMMLLALVTHTGIRLLPWILIGEVFSAKTRSGGAGLAGAVGYILGFLTNKLYIKMVDTMSLWGTYGFYGVVCLTGCIIFYFILPETEGKTLNDIENHFAGIKRLSNEVYRPKKKSATAMSKMREMKGNINLSYEEYCSKL